MTVTRTGCFMVETRIETLTQQAIVLLCQVLLLFKAVDARLLNVLQTLYYFYLLNIIIQLKTVKDYFYIL